MDNSELANSFFDLASEGARDTAVYIKTRSGIIQAPFSIEGWFLEKGSLQEMSKLPGVGRHTLLVLEALLREDIEKARELILQKRRQGQKWHEARKDARFDPFDYDVMGKIRRDGKIPEAPWI